MTKTNYKYFQVRPTKQPEVNGTVLRASEKKLDVYAGQTKLNRIVASFERGEFTLRKGYIAIEISQYKARNLREDSVNWGRMQSWAGGLDEAMGLETAAKVAGVRA